MGRSVWAAEMIAAGISHLLSLEPSWGQRIPLTGTHEGRVRTILVLEKQLGDGQLLSQSHSQ